VILLQRNGGEGRKKELGATRSRKGIIGNKRKEFMRGRRSGGPSGIYEVEDATLWKGCYHEKVIILSRGGRRGRSWVFSCRGAKPVTSTRGLRRGLSKNQQSGGKEPQKAKIGKSLGYIDRGRQPGRTYTARGGGDGFGTRLKNFRGGRSGKRGSMGSGKEPEGEGKENC